MIRLSRSAAAWRESVERIVDSLDVKLLPPLVVPVDALATLPPESLAVLWPAIAARAGVALDWRGTERIVAFTLDGKPGGRIPLSGGAELSRTGTTFVLRASTAGEALYS
jgi:hypothetical protein